MARNSSLKIIIYFSALFIGIFILNSIRLPWKSTLLDRTSYFLPEILNVRQRPRYLLVMFTCFKEGAEYKHHHFVHNFLIKSWANLSVEFKQILFTSNVHSNLSRLAQASGWDVVPVNRSLPSGALYFKDLYRYAFYNYDSVFYSFINGDILFDDSLIATLRAVKDSLPQLDHNVLIIGQRLNYIFDKYSNPELLEKHNLKNLAKKGSLFWTCAEDYFIFTSPDNNNTFDWDKIVDVVVGRVAYDNYAVSMANVFNVNTIDATRTLLAFHVSHPKLIQTGANNTDGNINKKWIGKFNYYSGLTTNSKYLTTSTDGGGKIVVIKRKR